MRVVGGEGREGEDFGAERFRNVIFTCVSSFRHAMDDQVADGETGDGRRVRRWNGEFGGGESGRNDGIGKLGLGEHGLQIPNSSRK